MVAPTFDATSQAQWTGGSPQTFSHTCTGVDRYLFIGIMDDRDMVVNDGDVSYNTVNVPRVAIYSNANRPTMRVHGLVAPATGANTVSITVTADPKSQGNAMATSYTGVDQTTPIGTFTTATGATTPATVTITGTTAGNLVIDHMTLEDPLADPTVGANQTARHTQGAVGNEMQAGVSEEASGGSITMDWTVTNLVSWATGAVELFGIAAAAVVPPDLHMAPIQPT